MCANAFTMRSADTCIFRDPYMKKRPVKGWSPRAQANDVSNKPQAIVTLNTAQASVTIHVAKCVIDNRRIRQ